MLLDLVLDFSSFKVMGFVDYLSSIRFCCKNFNNQVKSYFKYLDCILGVFLLFSRKMLSDIFP